MEIYLSALWLEKYQSQFQLTKRAEMLQRKQKQENKPGYFCQKTSQNIQHKGQTKSDKKKVIFYLNHDTFVKVCYGIL